MIKKSIEFAAMVLNLESTLNSLKTADGVQAQKIQDCIEAIKILGVHVEGQEKRLAFLEARLLTIAVGSKARANIRHIDAEPQRQRLPSTTRDKRPPKGA